MERHAAEIVAANELLARRVNDGIERGRWPGEDGKPGAYQCECAQRDCNRLIELTPAEYERVRARSRQFFVAPGHERDDVETVVQTRPGYLVVEKRGEAGRLVSELDPAE